MAPPPAMPHRARIMEDSRTVVGGGGSSSDADAALPPPPPRGGLGERSTSTTLRLRREGFRERARNKSDFAVRSIRRGSHQWNHLLRLFVADLAFQSLVHRRFQSEVSFRPYTCHAAVLFVDLSHYSRIAAAVSHRGAHALSTTVNSYLDRLLALVDLHGGDVVKFAGDAVLVVWEGQRSDLELNVLTAAKCVLEMQRHAGSHPVLEGGGGGTDDDNNNELIFRIHCGLCCGLLESEVFVAPVHEHMQRLYHSVGGDSVVEIGELVDLAKAGEVCVSEEVVKHLGSRGTFREVADAPGCRLLTDMALEEPLLREAIDMHVNQVKTARRAIRDKAVEEEFIHPKVIRLLSHGGLSPTQISQMRNLCVLFIAMTSNGSSVNWLMEVQSILDKNRCPST